MSSTLSDQAREVVHALAAGRRRIALAESCTGGGVAAELARVPGVSEFFCGSAVTYRDDTKARWLGIDRVDLLTFTAVSSQIAEQMARGVLERTEEADVAFSITGHLGPQAPEGFDGVVFVGIAHRHGKKIEAEQQRHTLRQVGRNDRQEEAICLVLATILRHVSDGS